MSPADDSSVEEPPKVQNRSEFPASWKYNKQYTLEDGRTVTLRRCQGLHSTSGVKLTAYGYDGTVQYNPIASDVT